MNVIGYLLSYKRGRKIITGRGPSKDNKKQYNKSVLTNNLHNQGGGNTRRMNIWVGAEWAEGCVGCAQGSERAS
jgi:hypothetical protein